MELSNEDGFLEELLGFGRETWGTESNQITGINTLFTNNNSCWVSNTLNYFQDSTTTTSPLIPRTNLPTTTYQDISTLPIKPTLDVDYSNFNDEIYSALEGKFIAAPAPPASEGLLMTASNNNSQQLETSSSSQFPINLQDQQDYSLSSIMEDEHEQVAPGLQVQGEDNNKSSSNNNNNVQNYIEEQMGVHTTSCKVEVATHQSTEFNMGLMCMEFNNGSKNNNKAMKKLEGSRQPSKNLMAERRRRKRLNDRLSMLRSVVPKISKMDRTSILGDTIDYMKELLEKINNLQEEIDVSTTSSATNTNDQFNVVSIFKDLIKPNDVLVRNSPKFDVERRRRDTRVEICCAAKPGLLLSTISALEQLGLEIQQCVISCFNDFSLQASCSEEMEQRTHISSEDVKQALFRNAGYGGRCL